MFTFLNFFPPICEMGRRQRPREIVVGINEIIPHAENLIETRPLLAVCDLACPAVCHSGWHWVCQVSASALAVAHCVRSVTCSERLLLTPALNSPTPRSPFAGFILTQRPSVSSTELQLHKGRAWLCSLSHPSIWNSAWHAAGTQMYLWTELP